MAFIEEARNFLQQELLPYLRDLLDQEGYVHRLICREDVDTTMARALHRLRERQGRNDDVIEDRELELQPYLLLIGNAGSGKSFILIFGYIQAAQRFLNDPSAPFPFFLDLDNDLLSELSVESIERALDYKHSRLFHRALTESPAGGALFLDGLDEVLRRSRFFINDLQIFLDKHWRNLKRIAIACRRAAWSPEWFSKDPVRLAVYHADHLGWEEYAQVLPESASRQSFFEQCDALGISSLLDTPFDGFYLAREFRADRPLPKTRRECLSQRVSEALRGREVGRQAGEAPPLDRLRLLARQLACLNSFTLQSGWLPQEVIDQLGSSEVLRLDQGVQSEEVQVLLHRPLFKKSGERFAFVHQLYQEFLTAEALASLPLRKQRQLLEAVRPGLHRIQTPRRGIAMFLAELSESFRDHLIASDALVAFLAETPSLPMNKDEELLRSVLDDAIANDRVPWWEIPPRGERPLDALAKHRPRDIVSFLRPYVEYPDEIPRLWGTACAAAWGGAKGLNGILNQIAHDPQRNIEARKSAIAAIAATKDLEDVRLLYDLFDDKDDQVRGEVLLAYRQLEAPSPQEFIAKLRGGSHDLNLLCLLQIEAETFGRTLGSSPLTEAFAAATEEFEALGNLKVSLLRGLFARAAELHFADIPAELIVKCWIARDADGLLYSRFLRKEAILTQPLRENSALFEKVWSYTIDLLGKGEYRLYEMEFAEYLADISTDLIFDLLPATMEGLNPSQEGLIKNVLWLYFQKEPTAERLAQFQRSAPAFTQQLRLPRPPKQRPSRDPLEEKQKLLGAIKAGRGNPLAQTWNVLHAVAELGQQTKHLKEATEEEVLQVLARTPPAVRKQIRRAFRECVAQVHYERKKTGPSQFSMTYPQYEIPFWVLCRQGEKFEPLKINEIICCYGFLESLQNDRYEKLLEELRGRDRETWQQCILHLMEDERISIHHPIQHVIKVGEEVYLSRCCERLEQGLFEVANFNSLLEYLLALRPADFAETLQRCYCMLKDRLDQRIRQREQQETSDEGNQEAGGSDETQMETAHSVSTNPTGMSYWDQFRPLLLLMSEDSDWAWDEFAGRLCQEDVPLNEDFFPRSSRPRFPLNPVRLQVLADWYAFLRRKTGGEDFTTSYLASYLLETIVMIGGEEAIRELRRLQQINAFPGARWLSHSILRIEDRVLTEGSVLWGSRSLLDFVNKEGLGVVLNERDLFEWVCQAIDEVQGALELRGESVAGLWNGDQPKSEPECQNVLWPLLQLTLQKSTITAVEGEEKSIGPNRCDFCIEHPRMRKQPLRVAIELKTARMNYGPGKLIDPVETQLWERDDPKN